MLRFLTAGESHGQALVAVIEGMPAGVPIDLDESHRAVETPARRLRPRPPDGDRVRQGAGALRHPPRPHHRRAHCPSHPEQGLAELAEDDACRARDAGGSDGRQSRGRHAAAARSRRSRRRPQVRPDRHSRRARTRQRARDRGARRRRIAGASVARAVRHRGVEPRHDDWRRRRGRVAGNSCRTDPRDSRRLAAGMRRCRGRAGDDCRHRPGQGGRRHARRRLRGRGRGPAGGPGQLRAVGSQARRPPGAGHRLDSRDQGRGHRQRDPTSPGCPVRASTTRSCRAWVRAARGTLPSGWRA